MPKHGKDLRQKSDPNQRPMSVEEMNARLNALDQNSPKPPKTKKTAKKDQPPVKVGIRLQEIQLQSITKMKQLQYAMEKGDEKRVLELTQESDKLTAEYCAILGYAITSEGKLDKKKLGDTLTADTIAKQTAKAERNPLFQQMKAGTSAPQAIKNMDNIGHLSEEQFARETVHTYAADQKGSQRQVDAKVDEILKGMGFDPVKLRAESAAAQAKPMNLPREPQANADGPAMLPKL